MANETIDSLAKVLAGSTSRRRALKGFAAVGAGGLLTLIGRQRTEAGRCRPNQIKCAGGCYPNGWVCDKDGGKPEGTNRGQVDRN